MKHPDLHIRVDDMFMADMALILANTKLNKSEVIRQAIADYAIKIKGCS